MCVVRLFPHNVIEYDFPYLYKQLIWTEQQMHMEYLNILVIPVCVDGILLCLTWDIWKSSKLERVAKKIGNSWNVILGTALFLGVKLTN